MHQAAPETPSAHAHIDDCWNRIGTRGDKSCPQLVEYSRCLNCPVFAQSAARLLDQPLNDADLKPTQRVAQAGPIHPRGQAATHSALAFRIAGEWLALPTSVFRQIDDIRPIHSLPHRRNRAVLGVVNVRGALTIAISLGEMLNIEPSADGKHATHNRYARMLVAAHEGEPVAFPVDEVEGVVRFAESTLLPVPTTLAHATAFHARGVLSWRDTTVGLLDAGRLFDSIARSLR